MLRAGIDHEAARGSSEARSVSEGNSTPARQDLAMHGACKPAGSSRLGLSSAVVSRKIQSSSAGFSDTGTSQTSAQRCMGLHAAGLLPSSL